MLDQGQYRRETSTREMSIGPGTRVLVFSTEIFH